MRTALLIAFLALGLPGWAHASGAVTVEITTTESGTRYTLHKRGYGNDTEVKTPQEIEAWLHGTIKQIGEGEVIFIYADDRIPFRTVVDMLRRFKAAGVRRFAVCTGTGAEVQPALSGNIDDLRLHRKAAAPSRVELKPKSGFSFPEIPPAPGGDPSVRRAVSVSMPTKLQFGKDGNVVAVTPAAFAEVEVTVGKNMATGTLIETKILQGAESRDVASQMQSSLTFESRERRYRLAPDKLPKEPFVFEYVITLFETEIPAQHLWSPKSGKAYKVLWTRTFNGLLK